MFKRRGTYYALFGKCCAFCAHGSGVGVWVSVRAPPPPRPRHLTRPHHCLPVWLRCFRSARPASVTPLTVAAAGAGGKPSGAVGAAREHRVHGALHRRPAVLRLRAAHPSGPQPSQPQLPGGRLGQVRLPYRLGLARAAELGHQAGTSQGIDRAVIPVDRRSLAVGMPPDGEESHGTHVGGHGIQRLLAGGADAGGRCCGGGCCR
jgi:hypothetical protein